VWNPGDVIVHQEVWGGRVWAPRPLVVVEDTDERLLLWISPPRAAGGVGRRPGVATRRRAVRWLSGREAGLSTQR